MAKPGSTRKLSGVQAGRVEPIFASLPQRILHDLGQRYSESALLWNRIYVRATPRIAMRQLLTLKPLWGSLQPAIEDRLEPYYWGFNLAGQRLAGLDQALEVVDGPGPATEVDLFLLGDSQLVLVEAKANSGLGRCARYAASRCPEIHLTDEAQQIDRPSTTANLAQRTDRPKTTANDAQRIDQPGTAASEPPDPCRYWEANPSRFSRWLEFGSRPGPESTVPSCDRHYQLARTLLVGQQLASQLDRTLHLWLLIPRRRWSQLQPSWLDFVDRIRSPELWRRMRVLSWEAIETLNAG